MKNNTKYLVAATVSMLLSYHCSIGQSGNYFSGPFAGSNNTTGDFNAFAGYGAGINNTSGSLNTSFGFYAGASNQFTSYNTSIGAYAGYFTASSFGENVFVGYRSGFYNSNGFYNVFLGSNAGYTNNSGSYNVIIGAGAGYDNTSGLSNTFIGYASGANNTTASSNTFVGNLSGFSNVTGANNSFFGSGAAASNTSGNNNAFFGGGAGYYNNATDNTFMGYYSGRNNTTGYFNSFVGTRSGAGNTSGYHNCFAGTESGVLNTTGFRNAFFGTHAGEKNTTGRENTFVGRGSGRNNTTGNYNTALGNYAQPSLANLSNTTAIGHKAFVKVSNGVVLGSVNGENGATVTAKVGIGTCSPAYLLHVNGVAAKPGGGSWAVASDKRLKRDVHPYREGLTELLAINPVWFRYNGKAGLPTDQKFVGVIAQEMQKILPHTIGEFEYENSDGEIEKYLDYDANALSYILVNAVKELNTLAQLQNEQIKKLEAKIAALEGRTTMVEDPANAVARLWQNYPNPYGAATTIKYYVPETTGSAMIRVISNTGQEVYTHELTLKGESEIEISNQVLSAGSYVYELVVDGHVAASKKMILSK